MIKTENNYTKEKVLEEVEKKNIEFIRIEFLDYSGITRGRTIRKNNLKSAMEKGVNFSAAIMSFNLFDDFIPNAKYGANDGDFFAIPDPGTFAILPYRNNTARMLCDLVNEEGEPWIGCPRSALKRVLKDAEKLLDGEISMAYEQEAYLLKEEENSLKPADDSHCFSTEGLDIQEDFIHDFVHSIEEMGVITEQMSSENGPGQVEVNLKYDKALKATDDQVTFMKTFKQIARTHGMTGTLMPKPYSDLPGNGLHVHISLYNKEGKNLFEDRNDLRNMDLSQNAYYFIGGLLKHGKTLVGVGAPTFNSYKRMLPGAFAPSHVCYGGGNRSVLVRAPEKRRERRFEFRGADGTCNPYLLSASLLAAGIDGIKNKIDPGEPLEEDVGELSEDELKRRGIEWIQRDLKESILNLEQDTKISETIGESIWTEFINVKKSEWNTYIGYISDWELDITSKMF